ncbi:MAG TPA: hypothetical protein VFN31_00685 [Candidatus Saccharimonadales bacterium]|nr:hypothetical protein [Candidatus Saccharimonadales bacterium]
MSIGLEYRQILQEYTPPAIRRISGAIANHVQEVPIPTDGTQANDSLIDSDIDTLKVREELRAVAIRFGGSIALLGANTATLIAEKGFMNTGTSILEPALIVGSSLLASGVQEKRKHLTSAYSHVMDILSQSESQIDELSKFRPLVASNLPSQGESLGADSLGFAENFESRFKLPGQVAPNIKATAKFKRGKDVDNVEVDTIERIMPSNKFGHFHLVLKLGRQKSADYRVLKNIPYKSMEEALSQLRYQKRQAVDNEADLLYTSSLLRTSVFTNLIRKGRRVLSFSSTR